MLLLLLLLLPRVPRDALQIVPAGASGNHGRQHQAAAAAAAPAGRRAGRPFLRRRLQRRIAQQCGYLLQPQSCTTRSMCDVRHGPHGRCSHLNVQAPPANPEAGRPIRQQHTARHGCRRSWQPQAVPIGAAGWANAGRWLTGIGCLGQSGGWPGACRQATATSALRGVSPAGYCHARALCAGGSPASCPRRSPAALRALRQL